VPDSYRINPVQFAGDGTRRAATYSIAAAVFLATYITWRPAEILFTFSDVIFIAGTLMLFANRQIPLQPFGRLTPLWIMSASLVMLGLTIGSLVNGDPMRLLVTGGQYLFSLLLLPSLLMGRPPGQWLILARALILGSVCMEAFGIGIYFFYPGNFEDFQRFGPEFITGGGRLSAFLSDANWNAAVIATTMPFLWFLRMRGRITTVPFIAYMLILIVALVLTASVTGMMSTAAAALIFVAVGRAVPSVRYLLVGAALTALIVVNAVPMPRAFHQRVLPALVEGDISKAGTYTGRAGLANEAWGMVEHTGMIGMGADQYRRHSLDRAPVHNIFLLLWAEGGLIALVGWLGLLGIAITGGVIAYRRDRLVAALAFAVTTIFIVYSNAAAHMYARIWIVPFLLALAPAFALVAAERPAGQRWRKLHIKPEATEPQQPKHWSAA
jgi:O-antigen ligase